MPDLTELQDPRALRRNFAPLRFSEHAFRWLAEGLFGEVERPPVDSEQVAAAEILEGLDGLFRCRVRGAHEGRGHVGPDPERRHVERAQALADLAKATKVRGVAGEVEASRRGG